MPSKDFRLSEGENPDIKTDLSGFKTLVTLKEAMVQGIQFFVNFNINSGVKNFIPFTP